MVNCDADPLYYSRLEWFYLKRALENNFIKLHWYQYLHVVLIFSHFNVGKEYSLFILGVGISMQRVTDSGG